MFAFCRVVVRRGWKYQGKLEGAGGARQWRARRAAAFALAFLGVCLPATLSLAVTFRESGDSFGNIARPYRAGTFDRQADHSFVGAVNAWGGDQNDVIQFSLSRPATVTITPSTAVQLQLYQGTTLYARNFPRFGSLSTRLPAGRFNLSIAGLAHGRVSYTVRVRVQ